MPRTAIAAAIELCETPASWWMATRFISTVPMLNPQVNSASPIKARTASWVLPSCFKPVAAMDGAGVVPAAPFGALAPPFVPPAVPAAPFGASSAAPSGAPSAVAFVLPAAASDDSLSFRGFRMNNRIKGRVTTRPSRHEVRKVTFQLSQEFCAKIGVHTASPMEDALWIRAIALARCLPNQLKSRT
ncbi:hypothetical protein D3C71_627490 [compost metagenome]